MVNYIKNLISDLSLPSDPADIDTVAFVKEDGSIRTKLNLNILPSRSMFFSGHDLANPIGAHLRIDSAFKVPITGYDQITDNFSIDFWQFTTLDTQDHAAVIFDIVENDSSLGEPINLIPDRSHSIEIAGGEVQIDRGVNPYSDSWGGSSYLFGKSLHATTSHPSGIYTTPSISPITDVVHERASPDGKDSGMYAIFSSDALSSSKSTHTTMGAWYRKNDNSISNTTVGDNKHTYNTSNFSYQSLDDGLDNIAMVHTNGIRIRGLDWSYHDSAPYEYRIGNNLKWEQITTDIDMAAPKMGYLSVSDPVKTYDYLSGGYLVPDSDRLYATNDVMNSSYLTGKRNIITNNFDVYNDATFAGYFWIDSSPINDKLLFKAGGDNEALELKVVNSGGAPKLNLSAGNGALACELPLPTTSGNNNIEIDSDYTEYPVPAGTSKRKRGNRWHEVRFSVKLFPAEVTLMTKKIGNLPSQLGSKKYYPNGGDDIRISSHRPNSSSGLLRWANNNAGISEFKVLTNQANMGVKHEGDKRTYTSGTDALLEIHTGLPGRDPFRTDNVGNLFLRLFEKTNFGYSILKSDGGGNDKILLSDCGTTSSPNSTGRIIYFEIHNKNSAGDQGVTVTGISDIMRFIPFIASTNMVHQDTPSNAADTVNVRNPNSAGHFGAEILDNTSAPNSYLFPYTDTVTKSLKESLSSFIIDEQTGQLHTFKDGAYVGSKDFNLNPGTDTAMELGFQFRNTWFSSRYHINPIGGLTSQIQSVIGTSYHPDPALVFDPPITYQSGYKSSSGNPAPNGYRNFFAAEGGRYEAKVALLARDWVYDPAKLINAARTATGTPAFVNDGIFNSTTGNTNPNDINPFIDPSVAPNTNVRDFYLKNSIWGTGKFSWPLADHLIYYKEAYNPAISTGTITNLTGETDEYKNARASWAGRVATHKGTDHGINKARAYILRTGGSIVNHSTPGDITSVISGLADGNCLLLEPGNYSITASPGGAFGMTTSVADTSQPRGTESLSTPFGIKNIMICGNTNDIAGVHINYVASGNNYDGISPIFGPNQDENTELAFLTFKKFIQTKKNEAVGETALCYASTGSKAYKVHFDFSGADLFSWSWALINNKFKPGTQNVFEKCVFSNYKNVKDEEDYYTGKPYTNAKVIDPIFSKGSGISNQILDGVDQPKFDHTELEPWWNTNDFSSINDSNFVTSPFKGHMKDFHLFNDIADNRISSGKAGGWNVVNSGINFHQQLDSYVVYSYIRSPNSGSEIGLSDDSYASFHINNWNNDLSGIASKDSSLQIMGGIQAKGGGEFKGGPLLSFDTLGQIVVARNINYNYTVDQRELLTIHAQDSTSMAYGAGAKWCHNAIVVEQDKIRLWKDGVQFDSANGRAPYGPFMTTHVPIKNSRLFIGAGNQVKGRPFNSVPKIAGNEPNLFRTYQGNIKDFRIQTGIQFTGDSFDLPITDQITAVGNTFAFNTTVNIPGIIPNSGVSIFNPTSNIKRDTTTGDIVRGMDWSPFGDGGSTIDWFKIGVINKNNIDFNAAGVVSKTDNPLDGFGLDVPDDSYGYLHITRSDSDYPSWEELKESGEIGYIPGLQLKLSMYNKDDNQQRIDWQIQTSQLFEPIVETIRDSITDYTNFYFNDYFSSTDSFASRPIDAFSAITGKNKSTGEMPVLYVDTFGTKMAGEEVIINTAYNRNEFKIVSTPSQYTLKLMSMDQISQGGFVAEGISGFDAYEEGGAFFGIADSFGDLL